MLKNPQKVNRDFNGPRRLLHRFWSATCERLQYAGSSDTRVRRPRRAVMATFWYSSSLQENVQIESIMQDCGRDAAETVQR